MKTDPTAGIAGTPLSQQAIESGNRSASQLNLKTNQSTAISDTVETSDREADGRLEQPVQEQDPTVDKRNNQSEPESGGRLDLEA